MNGTPLVALSLVTTFFLFVAAQDKPQKPQGAQAKRVAVQVWDTEEIVAKHRASKRSYTQFFKIPSMQSGIYTLAKGTRDGQSPHDQDELYYVVRGKAEIQCDGRKQAVKAGSLVFIAAGDEHRFVNIEEDLELLVVFSTGPRQETVKATAKPRPDKAPIAKKQSDR